MSRINWRGLQKYAIMFVLLGLMVLFSLASPYFLTVRNLTNIVIQTTYFIIVGVGLSFVMIGGGIDLSVGYQMSLVGIVTAMLMVVYHLPVWLAVAVGLLLGTFLGLINGLIVTRIKIFPLIATLATGVIFQGISYMISQAKTYRNYPEEFLIITKGKVLGVPFDVVLALGIAVAVSYIYSETVFGLRLMGLGGNEEAIQAGRHQHTKIEDVHIRDLWVSGCHRHHGHDLQVQYDPLFLWARDGVHRLDRRDPGWHQLHGRGRQCAGPGRGGVDLGRFGKRDAACRLGNLRPVHRQRVDSPGRGGV